MSDVTLDILLLATGFGMIALGYISGRMARTSRALSDSDLTPHLPVAYARKRKRE